MRHSFFAAFLLFALVGCSNPTGNITSQSMPGTGAYKGTFTRTTVTDTTSGTIQLNLTDTSYNYNARILQSAGILMQNDSTRIDRGNSRIRTGASINMLDIANLKGIKWTNSFYLHDAHNYTFDGSNFHIWQDTLGVAIDFKLVKL